MLCRIMNGTRTERDVNETRGEVEVSNVKTRFPAIIRAVLGTDRREALKRYERT